MKTPFQKKFPTADKDTVFEVVASHDLDWMQNGELLKLHHDDGTSEPNFYAFNLEDCYYLDLDELKIHQPYKPGDLVDVSRDGVVWHSNPRFYIADKNEVGVPVGYGKFIVATDDGTPYSWTHIRPHNPNEQLTLSDGSTLSIPPKKVAKLKAKYEVKS